MTTLVNKVDSVSGGRPREFSHSQSIRKQLKAELSVADRLLPFIDVNTTGTAEQDANGEEQLKRQYISCRSAANG